MSEFMSEIHVCSHYDPTHATAWFDHDCACGELWSHTDENCEREAVELGLSDCHVLDGGDTFATVLTGHLVPHAWTWGADFGKYWAHCYRCGAHFRFIREDGERITPEVLSAFWREMQS